MDRIPIPSSSVVVAVVVHRPLSPHNENCPVRANASYFSAWGIRIIILRGCYDFCSTNRVSRSDTLTRLAFGVKRGLFRQTAAC